MYVFSNGRLLVYRLCPWRIAFLLGLASVIAALGQGSEYPATWLVINESSTRSISGFSWYLSGITCGEVDSGFTPSPESAVIGPGGSESFVMNGAGGGYPEGSYTICNLTWGDATTVFSVQWEGTGTAYSLSSGASGATDTCKVYDSSSVPTCVTNTSNFTACIQVVNSSQTPQYYQLFANSGGCYPVNTPQITGYTSDGVTLPCLGSGQWQRFGPGESHNLCVTGLPLSVVTGCSGCSASNATLFLVGAPTFGPSKSQATECGISACQGVVSLCDDGMQITTGGVVGSVAMSSGQGTVTNNGTNASSVYNGNTNNINYAPTNGVLAQNVDMEQGFSGLLNAATVANDQLANVSAYQAIGNQIQSSNLGYLEAISNYTRITSTNLFPTNVSGSNFWPGNMTNGSNIAMTGFAAAVSSYTNSASSVASSVVTGLTNAAAGPLSSITTGFGMGSPDMGGYTIALPAVPGYSAHSIVLSVASLPSGVQTVISWVRGIEIVLCLTFFIVLVLQDVQEYFIGILNQRQLVTPDVGDVGILAKVPMAVLYGSILVAMLTALIPVCEGLMALFGSSLADAVAPQYMAALSGLPAWYIVTQFVPVELLVETFITYVAFRLVGCFAMRVAAQLLILLGLPA